MVDHEILWYVLLSVGLQQHSSLKWHGCYSFIVIDGCSFGIYCSVNSLWSSQSHLQNISCWTAFFSNPDLFHETPKDNHSDQILNLIHFSFCRFRLMYWTDWGRQPKIECAWMDGQQRQTLVSEDLGWPTGLSIDYLNNDRIYWSDSKENIIESMKPDGTDRTIVLHGGKNVLYN